MNRQPIMYRQASLELFERMQFDVNEQECEQLFNELIYSEVAPASPVSSISSEPQSPYYPTDDIDSILVEVLRNVFYKKCV